MNHPDGLEAAMAVRVKGYCLFCEEKLPPRRTKPRLICGSYSCLRAYSRAYFRDYRRHHKEA